ncbi:glycine cleavage system aminomethyltransferase GcvT [Acuticoccus mangrovi]|uniref:aminomethyltransferase n=1 Tax=Acuticoccus mangrovi TaxID=2796142 RepID=A0A934IU88_9HYPH|nr:glycine cleavage system aminomethyltransferase GcvT [Acuticoccus mangrovi]
MSDPADCATGAELRRTPLYERHKAAGARLVPFAGYEMPLQYAGIIAEHTATRESAGLFDVSHMGQIRLTETRPGAAAAWLERLTPSDIAGLADGGARYTVLTNAAGGVVDDLIITRLGDHFRLVVNGARRAAVRAHFEANADPDVAVDYLDRALIALQGPAAEAVLAPHVAADIAAMDFMTAVLTEAFGVDAMVSRCGYTGEDGFEVSLPEDAAGAAWDALVGDGRVSPVGLGARDTLRLEAGLCLYGQDLSEEISPVEAGIGWVVPKRRRTEGGFIGDARIMQEFAEGPARKRVGLTAAGRVPARAGAELQVDGATTGIVTSGGVGPTVGGPIAFGLVDPAHATIGQEIAAVVRGKPVVVTVAKLPFLPSRTKRKGSS